MRNGSYDAEVPKGTSASGTLKRKKKKKKKPRYKNGLLERNNATPGRDIKMSLIPLSVL